MSYIVMSRDEFDIARNTAKAIGRAIREAREARGESVCAVAREIHAAPDSLRRIEAGTQLNAKVGSMTKILRRYGLALAVVPSTQVQS